MNWLKEKSELQLSCIHDMHFVVQSLSCPTLCDHRLQHTRLHCPSLSPRVCSNPLSIELVSIIASDTEAETPVLWPPKAKSWLIGKAPDAGKDWRQEEKGMTEDEMVGWHHQLDGHEFEQTLGDSEGQGSLACCRSWGCKESDTIEQLNNSDNLL